MDGCKSWRDHSWWEHGSHEGDVVKLKHVAHLLLFSPSSRWRVEQLVIPVLVPEKHPCAQGMGPDYSAGDLESIGRYSLGMQL